MKILNIPVGRQELLEVRGLAERNLYGFLPKVFRISDNEIVEEYCGGIHLSDHLHLKQILQYWIFLLRARWACHPVDPSLGNFVVTQSGLKYVDWDERKGELNPLSLFDLLNSALCPVVAVVFRALSGRGVLMRMMGSYLRFYNSTCRIWSDNLSNSEASAMGKG